MTANLAPSYQDEQITLYQVTRAVALPIRRPSQDETRALGRLAPYPRAPFLRSSDLRVEIRFTLSNVDEQQHTVELLLDPWNEFVRFRPREPMGEEEASPGFSGFQKTFILPPKSRTMGTITPDDTLEMSIDLATAENILAAPPANGDPGALVDHVFNLQNRSSAPDPLTGGFVPGTIAGLTGFDLGLRATAPMNVAVELIIDVTDLNGERIVDLTSGDARMNPPREVLTPPPPAER